MSGMRCTREKCPIKELTAGASICTAHDCSYRTEPMTNADRIRAMSDEELAEFLCHLRSDGEEGFACSACKAEPYCRAGHNGMIDWLQRPAEEDD